MVSKYDYDSCDNSTCNKTSGKYVVKLHEIKPESSNSADERIIKKYFCDENSESNLDGSTDKYDWDADDEHGLNEFYR